MPHLRVPNAPCLLHLQAFCPLFFCSFRKMRYLCRWTSWRIAPQAHDADASKPQSTPSLLQVFQLATKEVRVGNEARHNEGVYLTLCLRRTEIFQNHQYQSLELSNGRCPGCDYITSCMVYSKSSLRLLGVACSCKTDAMRGFGFSYRRGLLTLSVQL